MKNLGPSWLEKAVFYQIYPSSFFDGNGDGIGDLPGVIAKLDYLVSLGVNAIWLNPCFCSTFFDGGYDITDFRHVDPRFGTDDDLDSLFSEAHSRGLKVCLDMVAGHTSIKHPWFVKSAEPTPNEYSNYYIWTDDWARYAPGLAMQSGGNDRNGRFLVNYFSVQPALNYGFAKPSAPWQLPVNHPDVLRVRKELLDNMRHYLDKGADGFRVDMACSLVKNDPGKRETIKLWREIRAVFDKEYPEAVLISEWCYAPQALKAGFHCDFMIHCGTPGYTTLFRMEEKRDLFAKDNRDLYYEQDGHDYSTPNKNSYFDEAGKGTAAIFFHNYLEHLAKTSRLGYISVPTGNHDLPRISDCRDMAEIKTVFAFLMMLPGVPFIYYGDEIGMRNQPELPSKEGGYTRTRARTPMQWSNVNNLGFSKANASQLYLPVDASKDAPTVAAQESDESSLLNCVKALIALRHESKALQAQGKIVLLHTDYPTVFLRSFGKERYLIAVQPADRQFKVALNVPLAVSAELRLAENMSLKLGRGKRNATISGGGKSFGIWKMERQNLRT